MSLGAFGSQFFGGKKIMKVEKTVGYNLPKKCIITAFLVSWLFVLAIPCEPGRISKPPTKYNTWVPISFFSAPLKPPKKIIKIFYTVSQLFEIGNCCELHWISVLDDDQNSSTPKFFS